MDLNDQLLAPYPIAHKARRWYKKVSVFVSIGFAERSCAIQSFRTDRILPKIPGRDRRSPSVSRRCCSPPSQRKCSLTRLYERHFPFVLPGTPTKKNCQRRCRVCSKCGFRRDTRFYCPSCPDPPGVCIGECYKRYHTLVEF